jgi:hypothetical protein
MVMSRDQNSGQNGYIQIGNELFETVEQFKYLGTTLTNQNFILKEIKSRLKSGNACYHSVQNLLSSSLLSKKVKIKISPSSSSSAALQPGVGFGHLYKLIPLLSISSQLLPILHLEHLHILEDSIEPSTLGSSCWSFPKWFPVG